MMELALIGGILIGLAVSLMLLFNGRVTGISGIVGGILKKTNGDLDWRLFFVGGLLFGGILLKVLKPDSLEIISNVFWYDYLMAGLLVGFGTSIGNGCTSGHAVCGVSRLSIRSIISTLTFMGFGILSVLVFKLIRGEL